ncbi:MAG: ABC transporter ATP-binding protein [bacterium]
MSDSIVTLTNLTKHFGATKAVDGISFSVLRGEVFGFLGPNGAGKTTTIRCLMDFYRPTSGSAELFGLNANTQGVEARKRIGFMPPTTSLNERWTGKEHIEYAKALRRKQPGRADDLIKRLDFDPTKKAKQLSTGNRQKLSLLLAFLFDTDLVILDEPTNGLDPLLQQTVYELIREARGRGATIFMSSHNLAEVERMCTRVAVLREGKLVSIETMAELHDKHLYTVTIEFAGSFTLPALPNVTVVSTMNHTAIVKVQGDIQPLLKQLTNTPIHDLQVQHASLEELFLEFYNPSSP